MRQNKTEAVLRDIFEHVAEQVAVWMDSEPRIVDERKNNHLWKIYASRLGTPEIADVDTALNNFEQCLSTCIHRGDLDTGRYRCLSFELDAPREAPEIGGVWCRLHLRYERQRDDAGGNVEASGEQPIAAQPPAIGRYETTKYSLFNNLYKFTVKTKLEERDADNRPTNVCYSCLDQPDLPVDTWHLCTCLALLCGPCRDELRIRRNEKKCGACRQALGYNYVITPTAPPSPADAQDEEDI